MVSVNKNVDFTPMKGGNVASKDDEVSTFVTGCTTVLVGLFNLGVQITLLVFMIKHW